MELSLDTASDWAGIAVSQEGRALAELTWHCPRRHSVELMPAVERLLERQDVSKDKLTAVFVCIGPGGYASLRVGVSTAKGLAFALDVPLVGVGRLEVEAYGHASHPPPGAVCPLHLAGRREIAWALYKGPASEWQEVSAPRLSPIDDLPRLAPQDALFCGEDIERLAPELTQRGVEPDRLAPGLRHPSDLAALGWRRLAAGLSDDPRSLAPLYLREPAIGPQKGGGSPARSG
jgi:tRNA threonylcarbamoyl adenosine modification protein YeaZ